MNEKLKKMIFIVLAVFICLFLFLFLLTSCKRKYSPKELELLIANKAEAYYKNHTSELPKEGYSFTLSLNDLVVKGIIDEIDKLLDKNTACSGGSLIIENNNNNYMFSPSLLCTSNGKSYMTKNLYDTLLENITTSGNGLYLINNEHHFRGDNVNNYLIFDGLMWRIMKINKDNSIRIILETKDDSIIWDNRYNVDRKSTVGYNDIVSNGINSRIKDSLDNFYNSEEILSNKAKGYIKKTDLCIGKRNENDTIIDGSLECSNLLPDQYFGLIQINEFMIASLDDNCKTTVDTACRNYNYLANMNKSYWSLTADSSNNYKVFKINDNVSSNSANSTSMARIVVNISNNTNVTGSGTEEDPYVVVGLEDEIRKLVK